MVTSVMLKWTLPPLSLNKSISNINMELNDLGVLICLRKSEVFVEEFQFVVSLKNWQSLANNAQIPMISCYQSNLELLLMSK